MKGSKSSVKGVKKIHSTGLKKVTEPFGVRQVNGSVEFRACCPEASVVQVAGDFNNWQPQQTPMRKLRGGVWKAELSLSAGRYCYRLVVDGKWQQDPYNKEAEPNPYGELNSVLNVN